MFEFDENARCMRDLSTGKFVSGDHVAANLYSPDVGGASDTRQTKRCPKCCPPGVELAVAEFAPHRGRADGLQSFCRSCRRASLAAWREGNLEHQRARGRRNRAAIRERNQRRLVEYLARHPCVDCSEVDVVVLDFDHVQGEKHAAVVDMVLRGFSWQRIVNEIGKCVVRCANCHRRKEAKTRGFYRTR